MGAYAQNFPVAVVDTAQAINQKVVEIFPLLNDYDPDGDTIEIFNLLSPHDGENWFEDSTVYYKSEWIEGWDKMKYNVIKVNNHAYQSEFVYIHVEVLENPDVPVAVEDSLHAKYLEPTILDLMHNDYDPNGDTIIIEEVEYWANYCDVEISEDSTYVIVTSEYAPNGYAWFDYRIIEKNTAEKYYSDWIKVMVYLDENEDLPIAIDDTLEATGGITAIFNLTENDHNPLNDTLEYFELTNPSHGSISIDGNLISYTSGTSYTGPDEFEYSIRYKNNPGLYSEAAEVIIQVNKNPDCPVGVPDYGGGMAYTPIAVEVISNDSDPNGDLIEIKDVKHYGGPQTHSITFSGDTVIYLSDGIPKELDSASYRIRKVNQPGYYSEWINIYYTITQNPAFPITQDDSASTIAGIPVTIDILENDIIHDTLEITHFFPCCAPKKGMSRMEEGILTYTPYMRSAGVDTLGYYLMNLSIAPHALGREYIYIDINTNYSYDSLEINNINAGINSNLNLFTRCDETTPELGIYHRDHFEVPKYSGKNTIFLNTIWIGGISESGTLHLAGERYGQVGRDYQAGPISNNHDSAFLVNWQRTWKLSKEEVDFHRNNWWKDEYYPVEAIASWPGNGDPLYGMPSKMAPYFDHDGNGIYDPSFGDYPLIRGDQCIFFMANDGRTHTETQGDSLRVEIHCMAYAFDTPEDSILNNTIFLHYDLINRSQNTYYDTYFGVFTDFNLGYAWDDFVGCHVMGNSFFCYNGDDFDGSPGYSQPGEYGDHPPAQSVTILAGPFMDADEEDNPSGGCDFSVNGLNFGNNVIDDERHGLSHFVDFRSGGMPMGQPYIALEYYQYMTGFWKDNTPVMFGGIGYQGIASTAGPECRYMWPGDTDPFNWGTNCILPNDGYNQNDKWWTEEQCNNYPGDRYGMGSCGPFTFHPGDVQEVDMAYVFANSYYDADSSKNLLIERLYELRQRVLDGEIVVPNEELNINDLKISQSSFNVYPNPARQMIYLVQDDFESSNMEYRIVNTMGTIMQSGKLSPKTPNEINVSSLKPGLYIISVFTEERVSTRKFIKY